MQEAPGSPVSLAARGAWPGEALPAAERLQKCCLFLVMPRSAGAGAAGRAVLARYPTVSPQMG